MATALVWVGGFLLGAITTGQVLKWLLQIYLLFRTEQGQALKPTAVALILTILGSGLWFGAAVSMLLWFLRDKPWMSTLAVGFLVGAVVMCGLILRVPLKNREGTR